MMRIANASCLVRPCISMAIKQQCIDHLTSIIEETRRTHGDEKCKDVNRL
jgi:hypothetical protein